MLGDTRRDRSLPNIPPQCHGRIITHIPPHDIDPAVAHFPGVTLRNPRITGIIVVVPFVPIAEELSQPGAHKAGFVRVTKLLQRIEQVYIGRVTGYLSSEDMFNGVRLLEALHPEDIQVDVGPVLGVAVDGFPRGSS